MSPHVFFLGLSAVCAASGQAAGPAGGGARPHAEVSAALTARLSGLGAQESAAVWVWLRDKGAWTAADLEARRAKLSSRAIARRMLRRTSPGLMDERDLAVRAEYLAAVRGSGATIRQVSRWLNAVSVRATAEQVRTISQLACVKALTPVAVGYAVRPERGQPVPPPGMSPAAYEPAWYGPSYNQLNQIGIVAAHQAGYTGAGVVIGVLDTGFKRTHIVFNQSDPTANPPVHPLVVLSEHDYINNDGNTGPDPGDPSDQYWHGTAVLSVIGGFDPQTYVGAAFDAHFRLAKTEIADGDDLPVEEDYYAAGLEDFEAAGIDVATSSLGYFGFAPGYPSYSQADMNGHTAVTTIAVNTATDNGVICCTAVGNGGHDSNPATFSLIAPADAYKVISCGAVDLNGTISIFSSDGPTADGRMKPEVLARGTQTVMIESFSDTSLVQHDGTSFSTPLIAGGTALIVQAHPNWTVDRMRRALMHTAGDFAVNGTFDATFVRGCGIVNIMAAIQYVEGDINADGHVDGGDVAGFVGVVNGGGTPAARRAADLNADGVVDGTDVTIFVQDLLGL